MAGRKPKYGKSMRVLAETNGLGIGALEYRLKLGIPLDKALKIPSRNQEISRETLISLQHLTFTEAYKKLGIEARKLHRLSQEYGVYFRKLSGTQYSESIVIVWGALHSPKLTYKEISRFLTNQLGFEVTTYSLRYRFDMFGFNLTDIKHNRTEYQKLMLHLLWSPKNEPV